MSLKNSCRRFLPFALLAAGTLVGLDSGNTLPAAEGGKPAAAPAKINVLVLTGGHEYNRPEFVKLFQGYDDIKCKVVKQKEGAEAFDDVADWPYDVIVLYNFNQKITKKQQKNFLDLLKKGVGLVVLHHANAAYPGWPEFSKIAGVTFHFKPWEENGKKHKGSGYKEGVKFRVHVADSKHPITKGMKDYDIHDETYIRTSIHPNVHALLTTNEPTSDKIIGWTKTYKKSKGCYLQHGHDEHAYRNPNYRRLVVRAIRWTAGRL
ncbi:MAG: ThuA domain-containing protein [Pirellulales bacterium]|nr:ThuA domain-containing protein [Pirellulales bacterium]